MADIQKLDSSLTSKSLKNGASRQNLKNYFIHSYETYQKLFTFVKSERSFYTKPEPLRHPLIFYYGHTACFYINKLFERGLINQRLNPTFQSIFAVGVDEMDWDDLDETHYDWPELQKVRAYRQKVKKIVLEIIEKISTEISWESDAWIILMGIEHEKIHLETSSVIIRRLPIDQIVPSRQFIDCPLSNLCPQDIVQNKLKKVHTKKINWLRGNRNKTDYYGWDNQFGNKTNYVSPFSASIMLVSNKQYSQFVNEGGYQRQQFWDQEGRDWLQTTKTTKPLFWIIDGNKYKLRTMNAIINMPNDWPAEVNNLQASAFCRWKSAKTGKKLRLPTEDQYMQLREYIQQDHFDWKSRQIGNINMEVWFSPCPVNLFESEGFYDIIGNVWQHCSDPIYPFEDFDIHPIYEDFTTPTFDGRHYMIKGGSFVSCGNQSFKYSRYAFRRHFYQFAGFRYVESEVEPIISEALKDQNDQKVCDFLQLNYLMEDSYIMKALQLIEENCVFEDAKFLHVGCSVGRIVLEMSKKFKKSYGSDFSARFFQMATRLLEKGYLKYKNLEIDTKNINPITQNIVLNQMNPQNPDPNKLNEFKVIFIDGIVLKQNSIKKVIEKFLKLMLPSSYLLIASAKNKNYLQFKDMIEIDNSAKIIKKITTKHGLQNASSKQILLSLYSVNN